MRREGQGRGARLTRWLVGLAIEPRRVEEAMADLRETRRRLIARRGWVRAELRMVREVLGYVGPGLRRQLHRFVDAVQVAGTGPGTFADVRQVVRGLWRRPAVPLLAVVTVALGISGSTAVFTVIDQTIIRPLPYPDAHELHALRLAHQGQDWWSISPAEALALQESRQLSALGWARPGTATHSGPGEPSYLNTLQVSAGLLPALGVVPARGRAFRAGEDREATERVTILTHRYWLAQFGGDRDALGTALVLDGRPHTIVGILPAGGPLDFLGRHDVVVPYLLGPDRAQDRGRVLRAVGRLSPPASRESLGEDLTRLLRASGGGSLVEGWSVVPVPLRDELISDVRAALWVLFGAVGCVLAIACLNVSNLLLARGAERTHELAVRMALGASRGRLARYLLTEAVVLSALGGAIGLGLAVAGLRLIGALDPGALPFGVVPVVDLRVLAFAAGISGAAGLFFGVMPALRVSSEGREVLTRIRGGGGDRGGARLGGLLIGAEVAFVLVLLTGATLMGLSLRTLHREDPGFDLQRTALLRVALPANRFDTIDRQVRFSERLVRKLEAAPGVDAAGAVSNAPFTGPGWTAFHVVDGGGAIPAGEEPTGGIEMVSPGYFAAIGLPLVAGRTFTSREAAAGSAVGVVNRALVERYWPDVDPIGRRIRYGAEASDPGVEVVGVVESARYGFGAGPRPRLYVPERRRFGPTPTQTFVIRAAGPDPEALFPTVRAALQEVDQDLAIAALSPLAHRARQSLAGTSLQALLLGAFGGVGMLLGIVGVYGVVSQSVARRRGEIGVRIALGASGARVVLEVIRRALIPAAGGAGIGIALAAGLGSVLQAHVYGVDAANPAVAASVAVALLGIAAVAALLPAARAARVDPVGTLREE